MFELVFDFSFILASDNATRPAFLRKGHFSAKYQLTTICLANSQQLTTNFWLAINFHFLTTNIILS